MKLLVDYASTYNLGDIAMLEGAVLRLASLLPDADIFVMDIPNLKTMIWNIPKIFRQPIFKLSPFFWDAFESRLPPNRYTSRFLQLWQRQLSFEVTLWCLESLLSVQSMPIFDTMIGRTKLGQFCDQFDGLHVPGGNNLTDTFKWDYYAHVA